MDGNDRLRGGPGADVLNGGNGSDSVSYSGAPTGIRVELANAAVNTGEAVGDTYVSVENLQGVPMTTPWLSAEPQARCGLAPAMTRPPEVSSTTTFMGRRGTIRLAAMMGVTGSTVGLGADALNGGKWMSITLVKSGRCRPSYW